MSWSVVSAVYRSIVLQVSQAPSEWEVAVQRCEKRNLTSTGCVLAAALVAAAFAGLDGGDGVRASTPRAAAATASKLIIPELVVPG